MASGISQQLRNMVDRARHYWAELTDENGAHRRHEQQERSEEVHQRYGGVRGQGEPAADDHDMDHLMRDPLENSTGGSQRHRQYTQQGGSGIQKTLAEQLGDQADTSGSGRDADSVRNPSGRRPGEPRH